MVSKCTSVAFQGIDCTPVEIQVQLASGLPAMIIVGLPDKAVAESRERVKAAITALGLAMPAKRVVINLAPADLAKEGSHFDLPIAIALLKAMQVIPENEANSFWAMGELSLDGRLLPVAGVLPATLAASEHRAGMICPHANGCEAAWAADADDILAPDSLLALINHFKGTQQLSPPTAMTLSKTANAPNLKHVKGQETAKRALEVAAAGGHNMLMSGPPGAGKSLLASCLPGILPPLTKEEMLEVSTVASVAGKLVQGQMSHHRPYRDPHHSSSMAAMVGGGRKAKPGEISLAHHGILFLDELPEFPRGVLEALRQPLESSTVTVARAEAHVTYPANVQLIAAMNPCRCGYLGDEARACNKAPRCGADYQAKLSGPLLDRIDLTIDVPAVETLAMLNLPEGESSETVAQRVAMARDYQRTRNAKISGVACLNAALATEHVQAMAQLAPEAQSLLEDAVAKLSLSMRGYTRVLRVARTIADLAQSETVSRAHIGEALSYRQNLQLSTPVAA